MTIRSASDLGSILSIWAHPDDEAYLAAGIMAMGAAAGHRVVCVTATKGEGGSSDPDRWSPAEMACVRERELRACLDVLGIEDHRWLGYLDGDCANADLDGAVASIVEILDEVRPDTVLTFGPDGFSDHPDHKMVSQWVTAACRQVNDRGGRIALHYVTQTSAWVAEYAEPWRAIGAFPPSRPLTTPNADLSIEIVLPDDVVKQKMDALAQQHSQTTAPRRLLGETIYTTSFSIERYRPAWPAASTS